MKPGLRFKYDAESLHLGDHIHPLAAAALLEVNGHALFLQEQGQCPIREVFLLDVHGTMLTHGCLALKLGFTSPSGAGDSEGAGTGRPCSIPARWPR